MKIYLSPVVVLTLKRQLRAALPNVGAATRAEAIARGLNYKTNAAMIAALRNGPVKTFVNEKRFCFFLRSRGFDVPNRTLSRAITRVIIGPIISQHTRLTTHGFGIPARFGHAGQKYLEEINRSRHEFFEDSFCDQIELALLFLQSAAKISSLNRNQTSYKLKHGAENVSREYSIRAELGNYVSNGSLILASIYDGFKVKRVSFDSLNAYINISEKDVKRLRSPLINSQIDPRDLEAA